MARFQEEIDSWAKGAVTSDSPDNISKSATPRARNTAILKFGKPAKRKGVEQLTLFGETGAVTKPATLAMGHFSGLEDLNWAIFDNGKWSYKDTLGAWHPVDGVTPAPFTSGRKIYSTAVARDLLFAVNGVDAYKTDGSAVWNFGIERPAAPVVTVGAAGNPDGVYRIALTRYNSATGHESSLSEYDEFTATLDKLVVTFPANAFTEDTQVTHIRVHIFKEGLTDRFWQLTNTGVTSGSGFYSSTHGGWDNFTTSVTVDVTDANINDLIIQSPTTQENNPPPANTKWIGWHGSRMFATDGQYLYYSKIDNPEAFDPDNREPVDTDNDYEIEAFATMDEEHLAIFKSKGVYALIGPDDPNVWEIQEIDLTVGIKAPRTLIASEGALWWVAEQALYRMKLGGKPERIDPAISDKFENLNTEILPYASAAYDVLRQRVLFTLPQDGELTNNVLLPFNTKLDVFEDEWNPMNVATLGVWLDDETGSPYVVIGNYHGRAYKVWTLPYVDGVRLSDGSGTTFTLKGNPTFAAVNSIADSGATFDVDGDGLVGIPVILVNPEGQAFRTIIESNSATSITFADLPVQPATSWTYYIGTIDWQFDTKYLAPTGNPLVQDGSIFQSRTFKLVMAKGLSDTGNAVLDVFAIIDHIDDPFELHTQLQFEGSAATFDIDLWDDGMFGSLRAKVARRSLGKRGRVIGIRFINREPGVGILLLGMGVKGTEFNDKQ